MVLSILIITYYTFLDGSKKPLWQKVTAVIIIRWILYFMGIIQSVTANFILAIVVAVLVIIYVLIKQTNKLAKIGLLVFLVAAGFISLVYMKNIAYGFIKNTPVELKEKTALGNNYTHYLERKQVENGNRIWVNICEEELREAWNNNWRHSLDFDTYDRLGQPLKITIIRFLASKNLTKDGTKRIYEICWSLDNYFKGGNPSGNTMAQKLEYWKTGLHIFKDHWQYGVGTGDVQKMYDLYYEKTNSVLNERWRLRAHNQYLTFGITFGILGLLYFIWLLFYTLKFNAKSMLAVSLWMILMISMLTEDNLESQIGVTFSMVFISLFFIVQPQLEDSI
jgi:hypothetical protein